MTKSGNKIQTEQSSGRNYGIDLLRILSMLMIVMLHVLRQGGILDTVEDGSKNYYGVWIFESLCIGAVDLYALISGFVGVNSKLKYYKIANLWLQVEFYCVLFAVILYTSYPIHFSIPALINSLAPVSTNQYWYFTAYFFMFFFTPFYNRLLNSLSKRQLVYLGSIIFVFSSLWPTIWQRDIFELNNGYSFIWLSLLYVLGGIIKKTELYKKTNPIVMVAVFIVLSLAGAGFRFGVTQLGWAVSEPNLLIKYYSANVVAGCICLFLAFCRLNIKSRSLIKIIAFVSPLTFGVYIIHTGTYVWKCILEGAFSSYSELSAPVMLSAVVGTTLLIFVICAAIEYIRSLIFKLLKISKHMQNLENKVRMKIDMKMAKHD